MADSDFVVDEEVTVADGELEARVSELAAEARLADDEDVVVESSAATVSWRTAAEAWRLDDPRDLMAPPR
ncbi:MAG: hypothetical protein JSU00_04670 [Acidobacteria bacterium]|nr:hypothetical protein [Acidobacteriota bacterium]